MHPLLILVNVWQKPLQYCKVISLQLKQINLKKLNTELPNDPVIPLLSIYPEKNIIQKCICTPVFTAALFISKTGKKSKCPSIDKWILKDVVHIYNEISAIKEKKIMPFAAIWMDIKTVILSEVSQTGKHKYHDIAYM